MHTGRPCRDCKHADWHSPLPTARKLITKPAHTCMLHPALKTRLVGMIGPVVYQRVPWIIAVHLQGDLAGWQNRRRGDAATSASTHTAVGPLHAAKSASTCPPTHPVVLLSVVDHGYLNYKLLPRLCHKPAMRIILYTGKELACGGLQLYGEVVLHPVEQPAARPACGTVCSATGVVSAGCLGIRHGACCPAQTSRGSC